MGNSALGRGTAIEENKVKASAADTADYLDGKVDASTILVSANKLVRANLTGPVTTSGLVTSITDKGVALSKLADGTDGELITWDAAGVAATVPVGTAGHILTSGGVGVAPTFQAPAGGAWTLIDHTTVASAATSGNITIAPNNVYMVYYRIRNDSGTNASAGLRFDNDTASYSTSYASVSTDASPTVVHDGDGGSEGAIMMTPWDSSTGVWSMVGFMRISTLPSYGISNSRATATGQHYIDGAIPLGNSAQVVWGGEYADATALSNYQIVERITGARNLQFDLYTYQLVLA